MNKFRVGARVRLAQDRKRLGASIGDVGIVLAYHEAPEFSRYVSLNLDKWNGRKPNVDDAYPHYLTGQWGYYIHEDLLEPEKMRCMFNEEVMLHDE